jgi:hypothetical protein
MGASDSTTSTRTASRPTRGLPARHTKQPWDHALAAYCLLFAPWPGLHCWCTEWLTWLGVRLCACACAPVFVPPRATGVTQVAVCFPSDPCRARRGHVEAASPWGTQRPQQPDHPGVCSPWPCHQRLPPLGLATVCVCVPLSPDGAAQRCPPPPPHHLLRFSLRRGGRCLGTRCTALVVTTA